MATQQQDLYDQTPDPSAVQGAIAQENQEAVEKAPDWQARSMAVGNQGISNGANQIGMATGNPNVGDPRLLQARRVSSVMQQIMRDASALPEDTDPMDKNLFVAKQVANKMWEVSPQIAGKALQQASQIQEAKVQQQKLVAQTEQEQAKTKGELQKQKITDLTNKNAVLVDDNGNVVWNHPSDDPGFADALAKARQDNPNATLTSEAEFNKTDIKERVALINAQGKVAAAMARQAASGEKMTPEDRQALAQVRKVNPGLYAIGRSGEQIADILTSAPDAMTVGAHVSARMDNLLQGIMGSLKASAVDPANPNAVNDAMTANQDVVEKGLAAADKDMPGWQGNAALHTAAMQMAFALAQGNVNGRITNYEVQQSIKMLNLASSGDKRQALTSLNEILAQKQATASGFIDAIGARDVKGVPEMLAFSSNSIKSAQNKINGMLTSMQAAPVPNIGAKAPATTATPPTVYKTKEDVKAAYAAKTISYSQAAAILKSQFGHKD